MNNSEISRRTMLVVGTCALGTTALVPNLAGADTGVSAINEKTIRNYYTAWERKDWASLDAQLAGSFTFSSAAGDDHIPTGAFKTQCWDTQSPYIDRFELLRVVAKGSEAFVMYICHTKTGKTFRNVEYFRLANGRVEAIECYFGAVAGYPTAVDGK